jgi:hypothetical protein
MGLDSKVLAIIPFQQSIKHMLSYDQSQYANVKDGQRVTATIFSMPTTSTSRELAEILGVTLGDVSTYQLTPGNIAEIIQNDSSMNELRELSIAGCNTGDEERFKAFAEIPGTQFFFEE